jgi:hypothetical protein
MVEHTNPSFRYSASGNVTNGNGQNGVEAGSGDAHYNIRIYMGKIQRGLKVEDNMRRLTPCEV